MPSPRSPLHRHPPLAAPRRRGKLNDAAAGAAAATAKRGVLLAHAQYRIPDVGVFGVGVYETESKRRALAAFYRHVDGKQWEPVLEGTFDLGRLWLAAPTDPDDEYATAIVRGLNQALLSTPYVRDRAARITLTSQRFHGDRPPVGPLADPLAEATRVMLARSACGGGRARKGPDPAVVSRAMFGELCHQDDGRFEPAYPGSGCDQFLGAVRGTSAPPCATVVGEKVECPRRASAEDIAAARQMGGHPPYETTRAHEPGGDPCCWFHPDTQARLDLQREVRALTMARSGATEDDVWRAVAEAEAAHPLRPRWEACDQTARDQSDGEMVMGSRAGNLGNDTNRDHMMSLYIAAYRAMMENDPHTVSYLAALSAEEPRLWEFAADSDPSELLEYAHEYAHETGNPAYVTWAHKRLGRGVNTGAIACTFTQRAQSKRARYKESMKAARPTATRRK